jgi:hypothetical protein
LHGLSATLTHQIAAMTEAEINMFEMKKGTITQGVTIAVDNFFVSRQLCPKNKKKLQSID